MISIALLGELPQDLTEGIRYHGLKVSYLTNLRRPMTRFLSGMGSERASLCPIKALKYRCSEFWCFLSKKFQKSGQTQPFESDYCL